MDRRKKIAAIVTTYFPESHANLIVTKFLAGFPTEEGVIEPRVDIVSMYIDQLHGGDVGMATAREYGVEVYPSIRAALTLKRGSAGPWPTAEDWEDGELAVDGVLLIAEHGDYPYNERDRRLYPRRHMFEQICGVFSGSGRSVPVFGDKHLSYDWSDATWMYDRARELGVPFMAGSSLPVTRREPELEHEIGTPIEEALEIGFINSYKTGLDSYGFHGLEALQCMVERRSRGRDGHRGGAVPGGPGGVGGRHERRVVDGARRRGGGAGRAEEGGPQRRQLPQPGRVPAGVFRRPPSRVANPAGPSERVGVRGAGERSRRGHGVQSERRAGPRLRLPRPERRGHVRHGTAPIPGGAYAPGNRGTGVAHGVAVPGARADRDAPP